MDVHATGILFGMLTGIAVGALVSIIILKLTKKDGKLKCRYDERQNTARGKGFKYGFYTALIGNLLYGLLISAVPEVPIEPGAGVILIGLISTLVYVCYCIWCDSYFSLNENRTRVLIALGVISIFNFFLGIRSLLTGEAFADGKLNFRSMNLFCGLMILIVLIMIALRKSVKGREEEMED